MKFKATQRKTLMKQETGNRERNFGYARNEIDESTNYCKFKNGQHHQKAEI